MNNLKLTDINNYRLNEINKVNIKDAKEEKSTTL